MSGTKEKARWAAENVMRVSPEFSIPLGKEMFSLKDEAFWRRFSDACRSCRTKMIRKGPTQNGLMPCILKSEASSKGYRKNWARLIQKIYEVDRSPAPSASGRCASYPFSGDQDLISSRTVHLRRNTLVPRDVSGLHYPDVK